MSATPAYATTPRIGAAKLAAAVTTLDGTGTYTAVLTGVAAGTRVERVVLKLAGDGSASSANAVRLWLHDGTTAYYYADVLFASGANTATASGPTATIPTPNLVLPSASWSLRACIHAYASAKDAVHVMAFGADLT